MSASESPFSEPFRRYRLYGKTVLSQYPMPLRTFETASISKGVDSAASDSIFDTTGASPVPRDHADITVFFDGIVPRSDEEAKKSTHPPDRFGRVWKHINNQWMLRYYNRTGHMNQFLIAPDGSQIRISQSWPEWRDTLFTLINPAFAAALSLMGHAVMHASSLVMNGGAFLIMGVSGAGKSTLSTALAAEGLALHSDDIAVMDQSLQTVAAGYSRIKVDPELPERIGLAGIRTLPVFDTSLDALPSGATPVNPADSGIRERWIPADALPGGFYEGPAPVRGIFVLSVREAGLDEPRITRLQGMPAGMALTEHLYGPDWLNPPKPENLTIFTRLADTFPVYRITMPDDLGQLRKATRKLIDCYLNRL